MKLSSHQKYSIRKYSIRKYSIRMMYRFMVVPLLLALGHLCSPFSAKLREGLRMRRKQNGRWPWLLPPPGLHPIWIHCASGEFEYAKPVLRQIKEQWPDLPVLVTYFTPSYRQAIERHPLVDYATPLPYDVASVWHQFLRHHQPRMLLIARTDLWPEMLWQTQQHNIPIMLFASSLGQANRRMSRWARPFVRTLLEPIDLISCPSPADRQQFAKLGLADKTYEDGDTRYDEVIFRQQQRLPLPRAITQAQTETVWIGASTWSEDETILLSMVQRARENTLPVRFIFCPHEPTVQHLRTLCQRLERSGMGHQLLSETTDQWARDRVLIIDRTGVLLDLYRHADIAFVGGSFHRRVHSVMEPLAAGCWTWFGPRHLTNREAGEFKEQNYQGIPLALTIASADQAYSSLETWLKFTDKRAFRSELQSRVAARAGATSRLLRRLAPYLPPRPTAGHADSQQVSENLASRCSFSERK